MTKPTFISLFSGAGGLDMGFCAAGFDLVWANETDSDSIRTHESWSGKPVYPYDIMQSADQVSWSSPIDVVVGGPPCQGFSVAGKLDPKDSRIQYVFSFMDIVDSVKPAVFVMENVKSLSCNTRWAYVRNSLQERALNSGYTVRWLDCNASHFGVPQNRERSFFVGSLNGLSDPIPFTVDHPITLREAFRSLPRFGSPGNDTISHTTVTPLKKPVMRSSAFAGMIFNGPGRPVNPDTPSPTVTALGGNSVMVVDQANLDDPTIPLWAEDYHSGLLVDITNIANTIPDKMRRITVQEAAVLQSFPVGMKFFGSQTSQRRQIGNAVPPRLALAVAKSVLLILDNQPV